MRFHCKNHACVVVHRRNDVHDVVCGFNIKMMYIWFHRQNDAHYGHLWCGITIEMMHYGMIFFGELEHLV